MKFKVEKLNVYKDDKYLIHMCKDHWSGLVVQVARFGPKSVVSKTGEIVEERTPYVVWQMTIPTIKDPKDKKKLEAVDPAQFRESVDRAVKEAREQLNKLRALDKTMDGVLVDYASSSAEFNKDQGFASAVEAEKVLNETPTG